MKTASLLLPSLLLAACTASIVDPGDKTPPDAGVKIFHGMELPSSWSVADRGETAEAPLPPEGEAWLDPALIRFSFSQGNVAYGDINWHQADFYRMRPEDVPLYVEHIRRTQGVDQYIDRWTEETIGGRRMTVVYFRKNPDGSVDRDATGGSMYFLEDGWVVMKHAFGDEEFEAGFRRALETFGS